jgi:glycine cleavage system T protein (aminomethyltransferase)
MLETYTAARTAVALFDNAADARIRISGPDCRRLNEFVSIDLDALHPFHGLVGLVIRPDASLVAVASIFKSDGEFLLFGEAERAEALYAHLADCLAGLDVQIEDLRKTHGYLSIVGPLAQDVIAEAAAEDALGLSFLSFEDNPRLGCKLFRAGFTGEYEYRFLASNAGIGELRQRLEAAGQASGMIAGDPAALPVMLLEVRSLLHRDIAAGANVLEAGLHWMINFRKQELIGGTVLNQLKSSVQRRGVMIELAEAGAAQDGDPLSIEGEDVGLIARVVHSPTRNVDISLAYVDADLGWVGVSFDVVSGKRKTVARAIAAPTVLTRSTYTS